MHRSDRNGMPRGVYRSATLYLSIDPRIANVVKKPDISIRVVRIEDQLQLLVDDVMVASACLALDI